MKSMLSNALREIRGLWNQLMINLEGEQGIEWLAEFKKFLRKEKCWTDIAIETLLDFISTVTVSARTENFIVRNYFIIDTSKKAKVRISGLGKNFKSNFLDKVENPIGKSTLHYYRIKKRSRSTPIINELGGEDKSETALSEMFSLMEEQGNGQSGSLLIDGSANIFFICDCAGVLWAVDCSWVDDGWNVDASYLEDGRPWRDDCQVFSHNPSVS